VKSRRTSSLRIARNWIRSRRTTQSKSTEKSTLRRQFHYQCSTGPVLAPVGLLLAERLAAVREWKEVREWEEALESAAGLV